MIPRSMYPEFDENEVERYQRENEELREVLRRCGELAANEQVVAIQHLVKKTLGRERKVG